MMYLTCSDFHEVGLKSRCDPACHRKGDDNACGIIVAPPKAGWVFLQTSTSAYVCCALMRDLAYADRHTWAKAVMAARKRRRPPQARKSASVAPCGCVVQVGTMTEEHRKDLDAFLATAFKK